jgi:hypothetical protein
MPGNGDRMKRFERTLYDIPRSCEEIKVIDSRLKKSPALDTDNGQVMIPRMTD